MKLSVILATLLAMGPATVCQAQPVSSADSSVEWKAARSKQIVRAVISEVTPHKLPDGLHRYSGIRRYHTVTVNVLETLKGEPAETLQFVHSYGSIGNFKFGEAQKSGQPILLFLDDWARSRKFIRANGGYAFSRFPLTVQWLAVLEPKKVRWAHTTVAVLSSDLQRQETPEQLLETVRVFLKTRKGNGPPHGKAVRLPAALRGGFSDVHFTLPADGDDAQQERLSFDAFKKKYGRKEPEGKELISSYERASSGYVGIDSLELMATDCDVIVRGVIEDSCFLGSKFDPNHNVLAVKLRVLEKLKGECPGSIGIHMSFPRNVHQLQQDQQEIVAFLKTEQFELPAAALGFQTRKGLWEDTAIVLSQKHAEVLFADLSWHRKPDEILNRLRAIARPERKKIAELKEGSAPFAHHGTWPPVFTFHPPPSIAAGSVIAGNPHSRVFLPVDAELEANALKWAVSEDPNRRWLGARAMIYFKTDQNAKLLKTMVNDSAAWGRRDMLNLLHLSHPYSPRLLVRWEAWHVLAGWGHDVPKPDFGRN